MVCKLKGIHGTFSIQTEQHCFAGLFITLRKVSYGGGEVSQGSLRFYMVYNPEESSEIFGSKVELRQKQERCFE